MAEVRGSWGSWFEFLFSALGSMVGLGNIWRFPYVCYRSGGGAFLIPFFVAMLVCGCPLLFLEILFCQYSSLGPGRVWIVCPLFRGIGFGMMVVTFVVSVYYNMIMGWTLYYLAMSFRAVLPWTECRHEHGCGLNNSLVNTTDVSSEVSRGRGQNLSFVSLEEDYWFKDVLDVSSGLDQLGSVRWQLLLCLLAAWVATFLCLIKGIKSMGKVVYVAATLPYIILTCLLIRGCLLPGAADGLYFYMVPDWSKLADFEVWRSAATQVLYSIGLGFGLISTLASYNKFHNNCYRDALVLPILDCFTSVFAGLVIFPFLGYMAHMAGSSVEKVADEGPGLVFIAYPAALATLPLPQIWSCLFFLMLFCVALDSQFMHVQSITTALADCFPDQLLSRRTLLTACVCLVSFLLGIPLTTQGGSYLLNLLDWYIVSFCVMLIVFIEVTVLAWIYGTDRLYQDIEAMIGYRPIGLWKFMWRFFTPLFVLVLWFSGLVKFRTIGSTYKGYPGWADGLGLVIAVLPILPVVVMALWTLVSHKGGLLQRLKLSIKPSILWGPAKEFAEETELERMNN